MPITRDDDGKFSSGGGSAVKKTVGTAVGGYIGHRVGSAVTRQPKYENNPHDPGLSIMKWAIALRGAKIGRKLGGG
jgi:hypothetical protein